MSAAGGGATSSSDDYGPRAGLLVPLPSAERGVAVVTSASPDGRFFLYVNGTNVIVRDLADPSKACVYAEHTQPVKVAKFSPSGKYVASGDTSGKVRVWAWTVESHALKYECPALGGEVEDLAWDAESKRILAVGGGSVNAKIFNFDTGGSLAEVVPHSKKVITCDMRPTRPLRAVWGGEDFKSGVSLYAGGPPFKYSKGVKDHSNFINCVRYSPDGSRFASFSADKTALVYAAEDGAPIGALEAVHGGGVYAGAWSPDGTRIATACGDKTVRVFDVSAAAGPFALVAAFAVGTRPDDMQQSIAWPTADTVVSTSLDGTLNVFNPSNVAAGPMRRVFGHREPATVFDADTSTGAFFSGCAGGRVCVWSPADAARTLYNAAPASGDLPTKKIAGLVCALGVLAVVSWDDKLRFGDAASATLDAAIALGAQPKGVALVPSSGGAAVAVVATSAAIVVAVRGVAAPALTLPVSWGPTCVDVSADGALVAVGGADKRVHFFALSGGASAPALEELGVGKEAAAAISVVAIAPDGKRVAAGDAGREIRLYDSATRDTLISGRWVAHTTRVTGLRWSPTGSAIASVSTDRRLVIWDPDADGPRTVVDLAHAQPFAAVVWASETEVWTLGIDGVAVKRAV